MGFPLMRSVLLLATSLVLMNNQGLCWKCHVNETVCEVWLEVHHALTMMYERELVVIKDGLLLPYYTTNISNAVSRDLVITGDGWLEPRIVIAVNGTVPGPVIEVHGGQTVRLHLKNNMMSELTSLHLHGQVQKGTPWMDGVGMVTQCPVMPGQSFTHEFEADPEGTFWYHSHTGDQSGMGMQGGLIVHPRSGSSDKYDDQFTLLVNDYNHDWDTTMDFMKMAYGMYVKGKKENGTKNLSGAMYSLFRVQSVLINGRGRFENNTAPVEEFTVRKGNLYRFRVIHSGTVQALQLSIDGHRLKVVATDGIEVKYPQLADAVTLTTGERYDFELSATETEANYWIRVKTLELEPHEGQAILRYEGVPERTDPTTSRRTYSSADPGVVVNCPFLYYPASEHTKCFNVDRLKAAEVIPSDVGVEATEVNEYFLNFGFPGTSFTPASVNGIQFLNPAVAALTQTDDVDTWCTEDRYRCRESKVCHCTSVVELQHEEIAQFVFTNLGVGQGWDHPIHMHGHSFWVLKIGYPEYDNTTGKFIRPNQDIDCRGNNDSTKSFCNNAMWRDPGWKGNSVHGLNLYNPVQKDTVNVPTGGYVVVRIKADNPGLWSLHCHVSLHISDGMMTLLNEAPSKHPAPPPGFQKCGSFNGDYHVQTTTTDSGSRPGLTSVAAVLILALILRH